MNQTASQDALTPEPQSATGLPRRFGGGVTTGLLAAATGRSFGGPQMKATAVASRQSIKQNPLDQSPNAPFEKQLQEWPDLAGCKAVTIGGDSGISRADAISYASKGAGVGINYYPTEEPDAKELVELIRVAGRMAVAIQGDIRDEAFCKKHVPEAVEGQGGLDILVNKAGRQEAVESIFDLTTQQFDATYKTNLYALFWITNAAVLHLKRGASIINTSSEYATDRSLDFFEYASIKACITNFTESLSKQLAEKGIRVNAVAPGPVWTPQQINGGWPQEKIPGFGRKIVLKRAELGAALRPSRVGGIEFCQSVRLQRRRWQERSINDHRHSILS